MYPQYSLVSLLFVVVVYFVIVEILICFQNCSFATSFCGAQLKLRVFSVLFAGECVCPYIYIYMYMFVCICMYLWVV